MRREYDKRLQEIVAPAVRGLGYELLGIQYAPGHRRGLLRIFIDHPAGIGLDDCERVSHQVSGVLDVENPIREQYNLEVSSPGFDRPLFTPEHFQRFVGHRIRVELDAPEAGRRRVTGRLVGYRADAGATGTVSIDEDGAPRQLPFDRILSARIVPEYSGSAVAERAKRPFSNRQS